MMVKALIVAILAIVACALAPADSAIASGVQTALACLFIVLPLIRALGLREDIEPAGVHEPAR